MLNAVYLYWFHNLMLLRGKIFCCKIFFFSSNYNFYFRNPFFTTTTFFFTSTTFFYFKNLFFHFCNLFFSSATFFLTSNFFLLPGFFLTSNFFLLPTECFIRMRSKREGTGLTDISVFWWWVYILQN